MFTHYRFKETERVHDLKMKFKLDAEALMREMPEGFEKKEFEALLDDALFFFVKGLSRKEREIGSLEPQAV